MYFPRSRALSSRICDGTVLRTMSSMLSTLTVSSMAAWSLSRGPRWRAANLSLAARAAAADDMCRGAPVLPMSARTAGWARTPRPSCEPRITRIVGDRSSAVGTSAHLANLGWNAATLLVMEADSLSESRPLEFPPYKVSALLVARARSRCENELAFSSDG